MGNSDHLKNIDDHDAELTARGRYRPPVLREFGPVGMLTCAGTGTLPERGMMAMMLDRQRP